MTPLQNLPPKVKAKKKYTAFCIKGPKSRLLLYTVHPYRSLCIKYFVENIQRYTWEQLKKSNYRCVKVEIMETEL